MNSMKELGLYIMLIGMAGAAVVAGYIYWRTRDNRRRPGRRKYF